MATNEVPRGPASGYVTANVKRLRAGHRWSLAELSAEMARVGRPMLTSGLNRIEQGRRRVDADDLVGLALALRVSPITLLVPPTSKGEVALTEIVTVRAREAWDWLRARAPLFLAGEDGKIDYEDDIEEVYEKISFQRRSVPAELRRYPPTEVGLEAMVVDNPGVRVQRIAGLPSTRRPDGGDHDG